MKRNRLTLLTRRKEVLLLILFFLFLLWNVGLLLFLRDNREKTDKLAGTPSEINEIISTTETERREFFYTALLERIGAEHAQEALFTSGLPIDGEAHLLNHTAGEWLYKKYGNEGMIYCKDYFLSSCYHGFIIEAIAKEGTEVLNQIMNSCQRKDYNTSVQCAHAIGHGMLAYEGYTYLPKALSACDRIAGSTTDFPLYNCYDGVFMENMRAVHRDGKPSPDRWLKVGNKTYPCDAPEIAEQYRRACWSNQPAWIYEEVDRNFKKTGEACLNLPNNDYQATCFDAIARMIHPVSVQLGNTDFVFTYCQEMPSSYWQDACLISIVRSAFSLGDYKLPVAICSRFTNERTTDCYHALFEIMSGFIRDEKQKISFCNTINRQWRNLCEETELYYR